MRALRGVPVEGLRHLCLVPRFAGHGSTDGALRTLVAWPEELAYALPDAAPDAEAPLLEPLGVALHVLDLGHAGPGTTAGVFGCGPLGLLIVQALRAVGASVEVATDRLAHRSRRPRRSGRSARSWSAKPASSRGSPVSPAAASVSTSPSRSRERTPAVDDAIASTRPAGRTVLVGIPDGDRTTFTASVARRKGLTLLLCRRMEPSDLPRAIRLVKAGEIALAPLVSEAVRPPRMARRVRRPRGAARPELVVERQRRIETVAA